MCSALCRDSRAAGRTRFEVSVHGGTIGRDVLALDVLRQLFFDVATIGHYIYSLQLT